MLDYSLKYNITQLYLLSLIEIQLNMVVLTKLDKNNDPMKKHFLINLNILYVALQLVSFRYVLYFSSSNTYECL